MEFRVKRRTVKTLEGHPGAYALAKVVARILLLAFVLILLDLTLREFPQQIPIRNVIPIRTMFASWRASWTSFAINVVGNIVVMLPVGVLLPVCFPSTIWTGRRIIITGFSLSLTIEILQWMTGRRSSDVDDLILNTLGSWLGWAIYRWQVRLRDRRGQNA